MKANLRQSSTVLDQTKNVSLHLSRGMLFLLFNLVVIGLFIYFLPPAALLWFFGLLFGFVLQRSRFCFAAAFRDIFIIGNTALTRAVIVGLIVGTLGFLLLEALTPTTELIVNMGKVRPFGLYTVVGSTLFGFGMVVAGGCATGMLMRMGEGYLMQWVAMAGFLAGSAAGAWHLGWWMTRFQNGSFELFLPQVFGWPVAIAAQLLLLAAMFFAALVLERGWGAAWGSLRDFYKTSFARTEVAMSPKTSLYQVVFKKPWPYIIGATLLAVLNTMLFFSSGAPWGVTSGITYFSGWLSSLMGISVEQWYFFQNILVLEGGEGEYVFTGEKTINFFGIPMLYHFIAIIAGSLLSSLLAGEFRLRKWKSGRFVISALIGGFCMGYGARLALGCNIGSFFSAIPSFSLHGWIFVVFTLLGAYVGGKVLLKYLVV